MFRWTDDSTPRPDAYEKWVALNMGHRHSLICGFCGWRRPQEQDCCPRCAQWDHSQPPTSGRAIEAMSGGDAHEIRRLLKEVFGYLPGVRR